MKINCLRKNTYSSLKTNLSLKKIILYAAKIWSNFKIKNMGDYHDLYLKTDVFLLADVFEKFNNRSLEFYKLDPSYDFLD